MKIATYNINNVNKRLANLLDWLDRAEPDVVCLQELKCTDRDFPAAAIEQAGYSAIWHGQRSWNGVAILARGGTFVETQRGLAGDPDPEQSRYIEAAIKGVIVASYYTPNGNPQPGPKFQYKLAWMKRLSARLRSLAKAGLPVVIAGDMNVVPTDDDIYATRSWQDDALLQPEGRALYRAILRQGWTDALHARPPDDGVYTFWSYKRNRWPRDAGLRIDHILVSPALAAALAGTGVDREERGLENASDHAPTWIELDL